MSADLAPRNSQCIPNAMEEKGRPCTATLDKKPLETGYCSAFLNLALLPETGHGSYT